MATQFDPKLALAQLESAARDKKVSGDAVKNIRAWLTEPRYAAYAPQVAEHLAAGKWQALDDAFWTIIPFGTGGRRGRMYPIGSNAINDRTIGESAQGLADYVKQHASGSPLSCAIAYDTRHNSRHFAELCAGVMVASGFQVFFLDDYRSTPELSFLVRYKNCACGIMVTASHNPPSDNAVKVYWGTGGQVLPPHDTGIIQRVMTVEQIQQTDFKTAVSSGRVVFCKDEVDAAFVGQVVGQRFAGPRELKVIYSPLHGVGTSAVLPALKQDGFADVEVFGPHAEPNGDFPNVPGHVSNPENPRVFDAIIERGRQTGAELILATDPDCDRMGCAAPLTADPRGEWGTFTGNQLGALLADFILEQRSKGGRLSREQYLVKTLVTTEMIRRIGVSYGVTTHGNLHVGFKWIAGVMDEQGPDNFTFGTEESHGFLVGQYARDKDAVVACMLMAELAASVKAKQQSLHQKLDSLFWQHGYHAEQTLNLFMEGSTGMARMQSLMSSLRQRPPQSIAGMPVLAVRDYLNLTVTDAAGTTKPLAAPKGDMVILDLAETGNYIAVRPSGTEPKVKFYMFTYVPAELLANLDSAKEEMAERLKKMDADLLKVASQV